jgi:hypothetical protein
MNRTKIIFLGIIGALFLLLGLYYRIYDPAKSDSSYEYLGIGTWSAGLIYYTLFRKYKEVTSLILGLLILHSGVILLLIEKPSNPKLLGFLVFTAGIVVVLNCGFSDYLKRRKAEK